MNKSGRFHYLLLTLSVLIFGGCKIIGQPSNSDLQKQLDEIRLFSLLPMFAHVGGNKCPIGYIQVPANPTAGVPEDFCVAKYEMKSGGGAASIPDDAPWTSINRSSAIIACQSIGDGYDLITNARWQAIARNIESVAGNWSSGSVGSGAINHGHADDNPNDAAGSPCDARFEFIDGDCSNIGNETDRIEKRTHTLSNGEVIWDFSGNAWEWVKDDNSTAWEADKYIYQVNAATQAKFGPEGNYTCGAGNDYCGLGYGWVNFSSGGIYRGGSYGNGASTGIFAVSLLFGPAYLDTHVGFRCTRDL